MVSQVKTFTKFQCRYYIMDMRFALPGSLIPACADPEHPLLINLLGLTICYCEKDTGTTHEGITFLTLSPRSSIFL